jgi:hypothetical protein
MPNFIGWSGAYQAIGYERHGELKGAVVYTNASPTNVVASIVLAVPFTRRFLYCVLWYPFEQLKVRRITAMVEEWNTKSICLCEHLGFRVEGRLRQAAQNGGDVIVMGLLKSDCRFLKRPP